MATRLFALCGGLIYTILGILGFIPHFLWEPEMSRLRMDHARFHAGWLGGFIPVNWPHNILWLIIGVGGIVAFAAYAWSKAFSRGLFVVTILFTFVGLLPLGIGSLWRFLPLNSWNVLIHAVTAMLAWYYGFVYPHGKELGIAQ